MQRGKSLNESFDSEAFDQTDGLQQRVFQLICVLDGMKSKTKGPLD